MTSLLARFASNIYWMARYLERAENLARILDINKTYAREDHEGPDWKYVLEIFGDLDRFLENNARTDAASVIHFILLDRDNPTSILSSLMQARQNARSVRHLLSTEMWTHINIFYNRISELKSRDIRISNLSAVCTDVKLDCQTIEGIAEGTFLRGEAWRFYQLGKYIERADQTTRVLDMGYEQLAGGEEEALRTVQWNALLRSVAGYHSYRSRHPAGSYRRDIAAFLLYDDEFSRSVALCFNRISDSLNDLEVRHGGRRAKEIEAARRAIEFALETGPAKNLSATRLHKFMDDLQRDFGQLSLEISRSYFGVSPVS